LFIASVSSIGDPARYQVVVLRNDLYLFLGALARLVHRLQLQIQLVVFARCALRNPHIFHLELVEMRNLRLLSLLRLWGRCGVRVQGCKIGRRCTTISLLGSHNIKVLPTGLEISGCRQVDVVPLALVVG
jgi:hypothetical protein